LLRCMCGVVVVDVAENGGIAALVQDGAGPLGGWG
jgi:hypothetical protein